MDISDWFMVFLTFVTGLFIGAVVYATSFKPVYAPEDIAVVNDQAEEFSVIGEQYGGFRQAGQSPSFRILGDGTYVYRSARMDGVLENGVLPQVLVKQLRSNSRESLLAQYAEGQSDSECRSYVDGIDYRYQFVVAGDQYIVDTCQTALGYESDLQQTLEEIWLYLRDPQNYELPPPPSFTDVATEFIRKNLSPYESDGENNVN